MRLALFFGALLCLTTASAQTDLLKYRLVKKDSISYTGRIVVQKQNMYFIVLDNDSMKLVYKNDVASLYVINDNGTETEVTAFSKQEIKKLDKAKKSTTLHSKWDSCFVVVLSGDTVRGRVEGIGDLTNEKKYGYGINLALADGSEQVIGYADIKELNLPYQAEERKRYIVARDKIGGNYLYRVIVDGKCKLVYRVLSYGGMAQTLAFGSLPQMPVFENGEAERFLFYYNNELTPVRTKGDYGWISTTTSVEFKRKCREIFTECPELISLVETENPRTADLRDIVKQFNQCLVDKK